MEKHLLYLTSDTSGSSEEFTVDLQFSLRGLTKLRLLTSDYLDTESVFKFVQIRLNDETKPLSSDVHPRGVKYRETVGYIRANDPGGAAFGEVSVRRAEVNRVTVKLINSDGKSYGDSSDMPYTIIMEAECEQVRPRELYLRSFDDDGFEGINMKQPTLTNGVKTVSWEYVPNVHHYELQLTNTTTNTTQTVRVDGNETSYSFASSENFAGLTAFRYKGDGMTPPYTITS